VTIAEEVTGVIIWTDPLGFAEFARRDFAKDALVVILN
jgi:hypothetical protein